MKIKVMMLLVALLLVGGILYAANGDLTVNGTLNIGAGGVHFPDGTTQTTAASPTTQNVVAASRAFGTVYQNTTGKPMYVVASGYSTTGANLYAWTASSNPPTTVVSCMTGGVGYTVSVSFYVLPGNYYKVDLSAGTKTLYYWTEWY